jgi:phage major head subunit gpT-like protein
MKRIGLLAAAALSVVCAMWQPMAFASGVLAVAGAGVAVTPANLQAIQAGFSRIFGTALTSLREKDTSVWRQLSMLVPSTGASELHGYLKDIGGIREWLGDRQVKGLEAGGFEIFNKDFEETLGVKRNTINDDKIGLFTPRLQQMAQNVEQFPHKHVVKVLNTAESMRCYDGQSLCDTDHPYIDENGQEATQSNWAGGSGARWFLAVTDMMGAKPIIVQEREKFQFRALTDLTSDRVFMKDEFLFGTNGRYGFAPGFWQLIYGSRQALTPASYEAARTAMGLLKRDGGEVMELVPDTLIVSGANEGVARDILMGQDTSGSTNKWRGTAKMVLIPGLA